jgi:hypothetical protein
MVVADARHDGTEEIDAVGPRIDAGRHAHLTLLLGSHAS